MTKHRLRYCFLVGLLWGVPMVTLAQQNIGNLMIDNKSKADYYFLDFYYEEAIKYYKLALKNHPNKNAIRLRIADSYRILHDYEEAGKWYATVAEEDPTAFKPKEKYDYASILLTLGDVDQAAEWYRIFAIDAPKDSRPARKQQGIGMIEGWMEDSAAFEVKNLHFNTSSSELAPMTFRDELVFITSRNHSSLVDHDLLREEDLYDIFVARHEEGVDWGHSRPFGKGLNTPYHEGPLVFFDEGKKVLFTRSNLVNKKPSKNQSGHTTLQIFIAEENNGGWGNVSPFQLTNPDYSIAHPAINETADTLFFSSNMPGGYGGNDIYMTVHNGQWSDAVNMGPALNTEGNESFPFFQNGVLFFSSDGQPGMGGLDVYQAKLVDGQAREIINLGSPINTSWDDFSFALDGQTGTGFLASNRPGGKGSDDIYSFVQKAKILSGLVLRQQDSKPLEAVSVSLLVDGHVVSESDTDPVGEFKLQAPVSGPFTIQASRPGYTSATEIIVASGESEIRLGGLLLSLREHDLFARGIVYDNETEQSMHDVQLVIVEEESGQTQNFITDESGRYEFVMEPGKFYTIKAHKNKFISDSLRVNTLAIDKGVILNDFVLEEEYVEKEIVFFDVNKSNLDRADRQVLDKVIKTVGRYPNDFVIVGAHADARGTVEYNQRLSDERAASVVDYLVKNGVSREKIIARGFGEGLIINRCYDGINCTEEDHSKNRRAEVKVEENLPEEELEKRNDG